ncbi:MAG: ribonuclease HII [Clostridia bacterium]
MDKIITDYTYEQSADLRGFFAICGIDEAGRGPLAGSVFAAAVVLPLGLEIEGLNDSKKLSEKKREILYDIIIEKAIAWAVVSVDEKIIDQINILQATYLAMEKACAQINCDYALIDGNRMPPNLKVQGETIVKGDAKSMSIAAASILAKVSRDREMFEYAKQYPEYMFEKHKGYGTKLHYEMLEKYGSCEIHRETFLKKFYAQKAKNDA